MDDFNTIRLKKKVIEKFKKFSNKTSPSYSETLDYMIIFFKDNEVSPFDKLEYTYTGYINNYNKRKDALTTILRRIEQMQLTPTTEILESLVVEEEEAPLQVEKKSFEELIQIRENKKLTYCQELYHKTKAELNQLKQSLNKTAKNFKFIKSTFGTNHYLLKLTKDEYNELIVNLKE